MIVVSESGTVELAKLPKTKGNVNAIQSALSSVMELLIEIRKEARANKDFATSDKIRNQLLTLGIALKDEKDGNMSWTM